MVLSYKIRLNISTGNLNISGIIHDCKEIAEISSIDTKKAGPFLTSRSLKVLKIVFVCTQVTDIKSIVSGSADKNIFHRKRTAE